MQELERLRMHLPDAARSDRLGQQVQTNFSQLQQVNDNRCAAECAHQRELARVRCKYELLSSKLKRRDEWIAVLQHKVKVMNSEWKLQEEAREQELLLAKQKLEEALSRIQSVVEEQQNLKEAIRADALHEGCALPAFGQGPNDIWRLQRSPAEQIARAALTISQEFKPSKGVVSPEYFRKSAALYKSVDRTKSWYNSTPAVQMVTPTEKIQIKFSPDYKPVLVDSQKPNYSPILQIDRQEDQNTPESLVKPPVPRLELAGGLGQHHKRSATSGNTQSNLRRSGIKKKIRGGTPLTIMTSDPFDLCNLESLKQGFAYQGCDENCSPNTKQSSMPVPPFKTSKFSSPSNTTAPALQSRPHPN